MQPQTKNAWLIGGGVLLAFILLSSFTIAKKAKEEQKPSGGGNKPIPQPTPAPQAPSDKILTKDDLVKQSQQPIVCPEGFVRVARGGVAGGIFYTCEPVGKRLPKPVQP